MPTTSSYTAPSVPATQKLRRFFCQVVREILNLFLSSLFFRSEIHPSIIPTSRQQHPTARLSQVAQPHATALGGPGIVPHQTYPENPQVSTPSQTTQGID